MNNKLITNQDSFGNGIIKEDKVIFVEKGLPNDIVDINIVKDKKTYANGVITNVVSASSQRRVVDCPYYNKCGGCNLLHQKYEYQLKYKENKVKETLNRALNIELNYKPINYRNEYNYRNKVTLHVKNNSLGLYKVKSNDIVKVEECLICDKSINEIISKLQGIKLTNIDEVVIRKYDNGLGILFKLIGKYDFTKIVSLFSDCNIYSLYKEEFNVINEPHDLYMQIGGYKFKASILSFFQVNDSVVYNMYEQIKGYAGSGNRLLDLYCGVGSIGIYLANNYKNVTGVEVVKSSYEDGIDNVELNGLTNVYLINKEAKNFDSEDDFDTIVVDPPRMGLDSETIDFIVRKKPKKVVYTSCDVNTLARDLKILNESYVIKEVAMFDMFPNSFHVETVCVLERR